MLVCRNGRTRSQPETSMGGSNGALLSFDHDKYKQVLPEQK